MLAETLNNIHTVRIQLHAELHGIHNHSDKCKVAGALEDIDMVELKHVLGLNRN